LIKNGAKLVLFCGKIAIFADKKSEDYETKVLDKLSCGVGTAADGAAEL
jgi:hypothetical protein